MALNPHAPTNIVAITGDPHQTWMAVGSNRAEAESWWVKARALGNFGTPLYRLVIQNKVDQYDHRLTSGAVN